MQPWLVELQKMQALQTSFARQDAELTRSRQREYKELLDLQRRVSQEQARQQENSTNALLRSAREHQSRVYSEQDRRASVRRAMWQEASKYNQSVLAS
jgi:hypothetical protein